MKKILALMLSIILLLSLGGCAALELEEGANGVDLDLQDNLSGGNLPHDVANIDPVSGLAYNYLTGVYDLAPDRAGLRPICISVNNRVDSLPQSGISKADLIVEIETEGGIPRLMCLYADYRTADKVGSVRSLRDQFIEVIYPVDPIILHVGTSIFADEMLQIHNINTIDCGWVPSASFRDPTRVGSYIWEHTMMTSPKYIAQGIEDAKIDEVSGMTIDAYFNFVQNGDIYTPQGGTASAVEYRLSIETTYEGDFRYDAATGKYLKYECNRAHYDQYYDQQLAFDNVFVLFADFTMRRGTYLVEVHYQNGGRGYYFSQGKYEEITWTKGDYATPLEFWRADGSPLPVNTGQSIITVSRTEYYNTVSISS